MWPRWSFGGNCIGGEGARLLADTLKDSPNLLSAEVRGLESVVAENRKVAPELSEKVRTGKEFFDRSGYRRG